MNPHRWRLHRAGLLNVWQYDSQVFDFAEGRLLLRGTNGAGKSKTLEMLLPFVLDGDRARMDASGKRGSLTFLMLDGYEGSSRTGYLWVELARTGEDGKTEHLTCGIGLKSSGSTKTVTLWCFLLPTAAIDLEDATGAPLSPPACREAVTAAGGEFFDSPRAYKAVVGRTLFGLDEAGYDELLRLLYWLRTPQVGESVEVAHLDRTLSDSLPELDRSVVDAAATSLDELQELGEQVQRRERASEEVHKALEAYRRYAAGEVRRRADAAVAAAEQLAGTERSVKRATTAVHAAEEVARAAEARTQSAVAGRLAAHERKTQLENSQEARDLEALEQMRLRALDAQRNAEAAEKAAVAAEQRRASALEVSAVAERELTASRRELLRLVDATLLRALGVTPLPDDVAALGSALNGLATEVATQLAAVQLCLERVTAWEQAREAQGLCEERAAAAEAAVARAEDAASAAADALRQELDALTTAVSTWLVGAPVEGVLDDPEAAVAWAAERTEPMLQQLHEQIGGLDALLTQLGEQETELQRSREEVAAERDPAPPLPALPRDEREDLWPLWRVVDPVPGLTSEELAGLEAALQASGLLDALVLPEGRLRGRDSAVVTGPPVTGTTLADLLVPAGDLSADVVLSALRTVALDGDGPAVVRSDGSWRLGALEGRADKVQAQYLGVVAREAERSRRLAALDERLAATRTAADEAELKRDTAVAHADRLVTWRDAAPDAVPVARARTSAAATEARLDEERGHLAEATQAAEHARAASAERQRELRRVAAQHRLPDDRESLEQRRQQLHDARHQVEAAQRAHLRHGRDVERAAVLSAAVEAAEAELADAAAHRDEEVRQAEGAAARYDARREALSATQQELQRALRDAADELIAAEAEEAAAHGSQLETASALTHAQGDLVRRQELLADAETQARRAEAAAMALRSAPGLLAAVGVADHLDWLGLQEAVAGLAVADSNTVYVAFQQLMTGSAGALQPRQQATADGLVVLSVRDEVDGTDLPLAEVAARLAARVAADKELLTRQHRQVCERHLLGELGEVLRRRRLDAASLVTHMNTLLDGVRTSQGIRVRLDWRLRDDLPEETRGAVRLLERPIGSLLPEQRDRLLELLSELIEASRRDDPDGGYAEHLRNALDYRRWSTFAVRLRRAGREEEERLSRRTALSQGEQKVVCYLPLFAAAAAHFSSLAAEAPNAPRFVLLDDAFPKIDVRTHPVLFGLLVDFDLDWLMTSERLWADCDTVPAAAIYEVIRSPTERGVLPFKHLWDGRRLTAVGA